MQRPSTTGRQTSSTETRKRAGVFQMTMGKRIAIGFLTVTAITLSVIVVGQVLRSQIARQGIELGHDVDQELVPIATLQAELGRVDHYLLLFAQSPNGVGFEQAVALFMPGFEAAMADGQATLSLLNEGNSITPEMLTGIRAAWEDFEAETANLRARTAIIDTISGTEWAAFIQVYNASFEKVDDLLIAAESAISAEATADIAAIDRNNSTAGAWMLIFGAIAFVTAVMVAIWNYRRIVGPIRKVSTTARDLADECLPALVMGLDDASRGRIDGSGTALVSHLSGHHPELGIAATASVAEAVARLESGSTGDSTDQEGAVDELGDLADAVSSVQRSVDAVSTANGRLVAYLSDVHTAAESVADGDLTTEFTAFDSDDSFGTGIEVMIGNLRTIVGNVDEATSKVSEGARSLSLMSEESARSSGEVANTINKVAEGTGEQNAALESVTQAVTTISGEITATAQSIEGAVTASSSARERVSEGQAQIDKAIEAMDNITASIGLTGETVSEMGNHSAKVEEMVGLIRTIADQTNLLALNAAIEAARAGDAGRGFAVVASEVKSLAEEATKSTESITTTVQGMRSSVTNAIKAMEDGQSEVSDGAQVVSNAGDAFLAISTEVESISARLEDVASQSNLIEEATESIADRVANAAAVAEENSASSEEVAATAEESAATAEQIGATAQELAAIGEQLSSIVKTFKIGETDRYTAPSRQADYPETGRWKGTPGEGNGGPVASDPPSGDGSGEIVRKGG